MSKAEEFIRNGQLKEALGALQLDVRNKPQDARLRVFLFQLDCLLGELDKALTQLELLANMTADTMLLAKLFQPVILCEKFRREVFAGKRTPLFLGEPPEWAGLLVHANEMAAKGEYKGALELRDKAFEAAPATPGTSNGASFQWIADADSRLGPMLEAIISGKYYWVPLYRVRKLEVNKPGDLRDLVWAPAQITWA